MTTTSHEIFETPAFAPLLDRLANKDAAVRRIALLDIAELEDENALPLLIEALLKDKDVHVRLEAARVLAAWETPEAVYALLDALSDLDSAVAAAAAQSLSELKDKALGPLLIQRVTHGSAFVRASVLRGLRELRYAPAFAHAAAALADDSADVRREAVAVIGWLKQKDALPELSHLATSDPDLEVRRAATGSLGLAADAGVLPALLQALKDKAWQVREEAAITLGKLRLAGADIALVQALDDEYWQVRLQAVRALGRLKVAAAIPKLAQLFHHPVSNLRKEVALALGEIGDTAALSILQAAFDDADPDVRKSVRIALAQIGQ